jgi:hypothetical protein
VVSTLDGGDDFIEIGDPGERLGIIVAFPQAAVDGGLGVDDRANAPRLRQRLLSFAKNPSSALRHDHEGGV